MILRLFFFLSFRYKTEVTSFPQQFYINVKRENGNIRCCSALFSIYIRINSRADYLPVEYNLLFNYVFSNIKSVALLYILKKSYIYFFIF